MEVQCHFFPGDTDVSVLSMYIFNYYIPLTQNRKNISSEFNGNNFIDFSGTGILLQGSKYITRVHSHISNSSPIIRILKNTRISFISCVLFELAVFAVCCHYSTSQLTARLQSLEIKTTATHYVACCLQGTSD